MLERSFLSGGKRRKGRSFSESFEGKEYGLNLSRKLGTEERRYGRSCRESERCFHGRLRRILSRAPTKYETVSWKPQIFSRERDFQVCLSILYIFY